ncbi:NAD-dependent deacetylase [candidate division KSB1 bacterium]
MKFSEKLISLLKNDPVVSVLTGAGVSAESGVETFRGENGLWRKFKPEELASVDAFLSNPELVWEWYNLRQNIVRDIEPNPGHYSIAEMENIFTSFYIITQNVDGLHKRAGNTRPIELHGNIMRNICTGCCKLFDEIEFTGEVQIPYCDSCSSMLRPDVVWFGEMLPEEALKDAENAIMNTEVFFSIGTSAVVQPAASMPVWAKNNGAYLVEINIEETPLTFYADESIRGRSGEVLPELIEEIKKEIHE